MVGKVFKKHGVVHEVIKRSDLCSCKGNSRVIAVEMTKLTYEGQSLVIGYNVEVIREGVNYWTKEVCEIRPSAEQFGSWGWSCINLCGGLKKFEEVLGKYNCSC